jgi:phosphoribosylanthranilate isomerase
MTWIKICGTTNLDDALLAVDAGANAVGFVFYEKSPRCVSVETAQKINQKLPERVEKVGVFVDASCDEISKAVNRAGLTAVQLHGKRSQESVWQDPRPVRESVGVSKVIPMVPSDALKDANGGVFFSNRIEIFALLIDSQVNGSSGGTGSTFDWESARGMVQALSLSFPVIIAGGLGPANAAKALEIFQPFGVDVASGVEQMPGKKDPDKVRAFVRAVRRVDQRVS